MDLVLEKEIGEMLTYLSQQNENKHVQSVLKRDLMAVFRADILRFMLYLSDDTITDMQADFINQVCGTTLTRERLTVMKHNEKSENEYVPQIIHLLVQIDNIFPPDYDDEGRKDGYRFALYCSWGMVNLYNMIGNRYCSFAVGQQDSMEKIEKRKWFLNMIGNYVDRTLLHVKYDQSVPYVPAVVDRPLHGSETEQYLITCIIENDNPYMPSPINQFNLMIKNKEEAQELLHAMYDRVLERVASPADCYTFAALMRAGAKMDATWKTPSELNKPARKKSKSRVESELLNVPVINEGRIEAIWHSYDNMISEMQYNADEAQEKHTIILSNGPMSPDELGKMIGHVLGMPDSEEKEKKEKTDVEQEQYEKMSLDELKAELHKLIGLDKVKQDIESTMNIMRVNQERKNAGLKPNAMTMHMVFMGNPGTGKTTVARLIAAIYKKMGILSKGQFVETDSEGLIAEYVGQTAVKTKKIVEKAMGGVLFIDEAYMLNGRGNDSFGEEAIATLIKLMEDKRDDLVVIFAGYTNLMNEFLDKNPGIRSRINKYITFENYTGHELFDIFKLMCKNSDYTPDEQCQDYSEKFFMERASKKIPNYSNGRDVRNYLEKAITKQADRLAGEKKLTKTMLKRLTVEDVSGIEMSGDKKEKTSIGFQVAREN